MKKRRGAFSLIELLAVIALLGLLIALTVPALETVLENGRLAQATTQVVSALSLAAGKASAENRPVTVRLIRAPGEPVRRLQLVSIRHNGSVQALDRVVRLPETVALASHPELSSLLDLPEADAGSGDPPVPGLGTGYLYRQFQFRPDGRLALAAPNALARLWFLTLIPNREDDATRAAPPRNFSTITVDPVHGRLSLYRP